MFVLYCYKLKWRAIPVKSLPVCLWVASALWHYWLLEALLFWWCLAVAPNLIYSVVVPLRSVEQSPLAVFCSLILRPGAAWCVEVALGYIRPESLDSEWKLMFFVFINVSLRFEFMLFEDWAAANDCRFVPDLRAFGVLLLMSRSFDTPKWVSSSF